MRDFGSRDPSSILGGAKYRLRFKTWFPIYFLFETLKCRRWRALHRALTDWWVSERNSSSWRLLTPTHSSARRSVPSRWPTPSGAPSAATVRECINQYMFFICYLFSSIFKIVFIILKNKCRQLLLPSLVGRACRGRDRPRR